MDKVNDSSKQRSSAEKHVMCTIPVEGRNIGWTTFRGHYGRLLKMQAMLVTAHGKSQLFGALGLC